MVIQMINKLDKTGKTKTLYECDMCGKIIETEERTALYVRTGKEQHKKWDLCNKCYEKLRRSIKKYKKIRTEKLGTDISV